MGPAPGGAAGRWRRLGALALLLLGAWLSVSPLLERADLALHDLSLRLASAPAAPSPEAGVVIEVDEASLQALPAPLALLHGELARLFEALAAARPRAVVVDLVLPDRSYDALVPGSDERLLRALLTLREATVLVLATTVDAGGTPRPIHRPFVAAAGPGGTGLALFDTDRDGVVRRFGERLADDGGALPTMVGEATRRLGRTPVEGWVDFSRVRPPAHVPLHEVLTRSDDTAALAAAFGGRLVFVGAALPFEDRHRTPLQTGGATVPGVQVHLQMLQAQLANAGLQPAPGAALVLAGALLAALGLAARGAWRAGLAVAAVTALLALAQAMVLKRGVSLPLASLWVAAALAAGARLVVDSALELVARRRLRAAFAGYVSPAVMQALEAGRLDGMASERRAIAVLFMDIRGFTGRAEASPPEVVISTINLVFEAATDAIHRHGGTVKEFMGDGVMAFFGAPQGLPNAAQAAFDAARAIVAALPAVNAQVAARGQPPLRVGIGIASGDAVVGHVGAAARHAYGAVGDCVNVASRLEGLTKVHGHTVLMSDAVRRSLTDADGVVALGEAALKGHSAVQVHGWGPAIDG